MFSKICGRFNGRSGKARETLVAAACIAALVAGAGGGALLAQLSGGNPVPNTELNGCDAEVECTITNPNTHVVYTCIGFVDGAVGDNNQGSVYASNYSCGYVNVYYPDGGYTSIPCPEAEVIGSCTSAMAPTPNGSIPPASLAETLHRSAASSVGGRS